MKGIVRDIVASLIVVIITFAGCQFTVQQYRIQQVSMLPNLEEGQRIFVNKVVYLLHKPERGDIIVFKPQDSTNDIPLIKRIIGLPGETVEIKIGVVYVNGSPLEEFYVEELPRYTLKPFVVPAEHYFVLGDNRNNSRDSHEGWTVPETDILGKAWVSIWPPEKWGPFPHYAYASE